MSKSRSFLNPLSRYDYIEQKQFDAIDFGVDIKVDANDRIISVTENGSLLGTVKMSLADNKLSLIGKDGKEFSTVDLPLVDVIESAEYDEASSSLIIKVKLSDGTSKDIIVPFNDMLDDYAKHEDLKTESQKRAEEDVLIRASIKAAVEDIEENELAINNLNETKQDKLVAGENIELQDNVISAHIDLSAYDTIESVDAKLALKANQSDLDATNEEVARKANQTGLNKTNSEVAKKADKSYVDEQLALKADKSALDATNSEVALKANQSDLDATNEAVSKKAEQSYVDEQLALKADKSDTYTKAEVDEKVNSKPNADSVYSKEDMDAKLELKADKTFVDEQLALKANQSDLNETNAQVALKANQSALDETNAKLDEEINSRIQGDEAITNKLNETDKVVATKANQSDLDAANKLISTKANQNDMEVALAKKADKGECYTKEEDNLLFANKLDKSVYEEDKPTFALKSEIPSIDGLVNEEALALKADKSALESEVATRTSEDSALDAKITSANEAISNLGQKVASLKVVKVSNLQYDINLGEEVKGSINIPKDQFLKSVSYNTDTNSLDFVFVTSESDNEVVSVDVKDLVDTYVNGNGLSLSGNTFSINLDPTTQKYLTLSAEGLKLEGIDDTFMKIEDANGKYQPVGDYATIESVNAVDSKFANYHDKASSESLMDSKDATNLQSAKTYAEEKANAANVDAISKANKYADDLVTPMSAIISKHGTEILQLDNRCDHFDVLFQSILEEHEGTIVVDFYTKNQIDEKLALKANKEDVEKALALKLDVAEHNRVKALVQENLTYKANKTDVNEALALKADKEEIKDAVKTTAIPSEDMPNRKAIVMENHDALMGKSKSGLTNIAMISKWDVADFGSKAVHCNLNGKLERPTYNDDKGIALISDVEVKADQSSLDETNAQVALKADETKVTELSTQIGSIKIEKINPLQYSLMIGEEVKGSIDIPKDQFLKSVSFVDETNSLKFIFSTIEDENKEIVVDINKLVDVYTNGDGLKLEGNVFSVVVAQDSEKYLSVSNSGVAIKGIDAALALKTDLTEHNRVKNLVQENLSIKANKEDVNAALALKADQENLNALNTLVGKVSNTLKEQIEAETGERKAKDSEIEASVKDAVKTTAIPNDELPNRKAIVMENHDALMGKSSTTSMVNIAMISKWDVADFGSKAVHCNLNGKSERPTYNDDKAIALISDVEAKVDAAWVNEQGFLKEIPAEYVTEEELVAKGFLTEHQDVSTKANKEDVTAALALKADKTELPSIEGLAKESVVNAALALKADKTELPSIEGLAKESVVNEALELKADKTDVEDVVKTTAIPNDELPNRKAIVLENHDVLMGKSKAGLTNIAMISKWDVADFGSKAVHCNLNGKFERPTYNDNQPIAIAEDIFNTQDAAKAHFDVLMSKISQLEDKLSKASEQGANQVVPTGEDISENNTNTNYVISGEFANKVNVSGKDIIVKDLVTSAGQNHVFSSNDGEITIKNCNYSGEHPKSVSNVEIGIQSNDIVNIKDCQFNTNTYNQIEVSLNGAYTAKGINVDNCYFGGKKSNNAMSIFGLKDNAVINITNCVFEDVSNPLRISNHSNAKNVTINIVDCKVNKWESKPDNHGFICFQDYTSGSAEAELANKQFSTMVVNFVNLVGPEGRILPNATQEEVCGSKDEKQLIYVYYNKGGLMPYSKEYFPLVNVR